MGSPTYMSPEQCKDSADVDHRSDIYAFGTILYEMLAGRPPHVAATGVELLLMHMSEKPRPLGDLCPSVPIHVADAVMRALRQDRSERFDTMADFLGALTKGGAGSPSETLLGAYALTPMPISVAGVGRSDPGSDANSFPPTYAQAISESGIETRPARKPLVRWFGMALVGLVVAVLGFVLLPRGEHDVVSSATRGASVTSAGLAALVPQSPSGSAVAAILVGGPDCGVGSSALTVMPGVKEVTGTARPTSVEGLATSRPQAAHPRPASVKRIGRLGRRASETTKTSGQRDQEDIAGF